MYASPHYPTPPPGYGFEYRHDTPPMSPSHTAREYYSPRHGPTPTPTSRGTPKPSAHARRASYAVPPQYAAYTSPRPGPMPAFGADFSTPRAYATPRATPDYVSYFAFPPPPGRHRRDADVPPLKRPHRERKRRPSQSAPPFHTHVVYDDRGYGYECGYDDVHDGPPPPYEQYARHAMYGDADRCYHDQVPIYESQPQPKPSRTRRASDYARPQPAAFSPKKTKKAAPAKEKTKRKATADDAQRAGIPAGYSYKNWDPEEEPIMLLGSVFDADSLGKWIFDWTVYHYGPGTPIAEMAGELWLLLIHLAAKVKRSLETRHRIRKDANKEMVDDFLESGERLWIRFAMLLKVCEDYMWKAAKQEAGVEKPVSMGKNTGVEFVESIFGRDRELEKTEKLMTGMRLWSHRFDVNCLPILDHPTL